MDNVFISTYDAMPPLNRLCECKFESFPTTKARLVEDIKNNRIIWLYQQKNFVFSNMPSVIAWRIVDTHDESVQWLQQLPNFNEPSAEEKEPSSLGINNL